MSGLDEARVLRVVSERLTQFLDARCEHVVTDCRITPDGREQIFPRNRLCSARDQQLQDRGGLRGESDLSLAGPEPSARRVETMATEANVLSHWVLSESARSTVIPEKSRRPSRTSSHELLYLLSAESRRASNPFGTRRRDHAAIADCDVVGN